MHYIMYAIYIFLSIPTRIWKYSMLSHDFPKGVRIFPKGVRIFPKGVRIFPKGVRVLGNTGTGKVSCLHSTVYVQIQKCRDPTR